MLISTINKSNHRLLNYAVKGIVIEWMFRFVFRNRLGSNEDFRLE